jgi:hypothetical protein
MPGVLTPTPLSPTLSGMRASIIGENLERSGKRTWPSPDKREFWKLRFGGIFPRSGARVRPGVVLERKGSLSLDGGRDADNGLFPVGRRYSLWHPCWSVSNHYEVPGSVHTGSIFSDLANSASFCFGSPSPYSISHLGEEDLTLEVNSFKSCQTGFSSTGILRRIGQLTINRLIRSWPVKGGGPPNSRYCFMAAASIQRTKV